MLLGDSITGTTCYPPFLWEDLRQNGDTDFVYAGTLITNYSQGVTCAGIAYYQANEGHSGYKTPQMVAELPGWLQQTHPDIIVMHAGTNNFWNGATDSIISLTLQNYSTMVDSMRADNQNVKIIVAQIIPMMYSSASHAATNALDDSIPAWANAKSTQQSPIMVVDLRTGFDSAAYLYTDGVHPNEAGSKWIADRVYPVLSTVLTALPIQLSSFSASSMNEARVQLSWTTVSEVNNYGFSVERRSENETAFHTISNFIPGAGTSLEQHDYSFIDSAIVAGTYYYRLKQIDLDGKYTYSNEIVVRVTGVMGITEHATPQVFQLMQNYPNPFNPTTAITFTVGKREHATLTVFNMLGQAVATLFDGIAEPGRYYNIPLDGSRLGSGVYTYRIVTESNTAARKMILVK
jgi:lysophospholipase L1-like esterase